MPADFSLLALVASHGWYQLSPFHFDPPARQLSLVLCRTGAAPVTATVAGSGRRAVRVTTSRPLRAREQAWLLARLARVLALDVELGPFHRVCRREPDLAWIARRRLGRLLRSADLWEDALKTLLTTNCTWRQTVSMTERLVASFGAPDPATGRRAFPTPAAIARGGLARLTEEVRLGYRARGAIELAERADAGELDVLEALDDESLRTTIRGWHGFGEYAARSLLHLLGRESDPVVDSWAIAQAREHRVPGRAATPAGLRRYYRRFGPWRALVAWFDLNQDHYAEWPPRFGIT